MTTAEDVARTQTLALSTWCIRMAALASEHKAARSEAERRRIEAALVAVALEVVS